VGKWLIVTFALWLALTAGAVAWRTNGWSKSDVPIARSGAQIAINNTLDTLAAPALVGTYVFRTYPILKTRWGTALTYGLGFAVPCCAAFVLIASHGRLRRPRSKPEHDGPADPSRRRLLVDGAAAGAGLVMFSAPVYAAAIEPNLITVRTYRVPIKGLPSALDGFRIVQLSDTHLGPRVHASHIEHAVRIAIEQKPDLIALTGDYVHQSAGVIEAAAELFKPLMDAPGIKGIVGVLGNHDWHTDGERMGRALTDLGVRMIDNDRVFLDAASRTLTSQPPTDPASALCIVGLGDLLTATVEPERAFVGIHADTPRVLLAHVPDTLELESVRAPSGPRIDLALCGHTHGGQIRIPFLGTPVVPSDYGQKYAGGLIPADVCAAACPVIVSRGIGTSILPVRIGVPPEVVVVELRRMQPDA
jgi:predicted MPP superfamily phosphohydrolase